MGRIEELKDEILEYFEENEDEFNEVIEDLDSWCGYLGDDRYYYMEELDELYHDQPATEILYRAYYGHDEFYTTDSHGERQYEEFNPNRTYFYFNGYGNLVSSDYKDYSSHLDMYFVEKVIDEEVNLNSLPLEVMELLEQIANEEESEDEEDV